MSGKKSFTNHSNFDLRVTLLVRQGDDIGKPSLEETFLINSKQKDLEVKYGNDQNIFLNGLVFNWKDPKTQSMQTMRQEVIATGVKPTFDWELNTHSKIAINDVENLNITATN
jgi:hypothetical protein